MRKNQCSPIASILSLLLLSFSARTHGADISVRTIEGTETPMILVSGDIVRGDESKFRRISLEHENAVVLLDSMGGTLGPALSIGEAIRLREYVTVVPNGSVCASACALVWLAGERRALSPAGKVGFHASYYEENGQRIETGVGNAVIGHYLSRLNLPEKAVVFATSSSPHQITWLNESNRESSGIYFDVFPDVETSKTLRPHSANAIGSLDKVLTFDNAYECKMSKKSLAIFEGLVSVDKNTWEVTQGAGIQLPGSAVAVVPTFSRNRVSGEGYDAAEVLATLPVSASWMGLRVNEIQYAFYEQSSNYEYRIVFDNSASHVLEKLNTHGFRLRGVGIPNVFRPEGEASYGVVLKQIGARSELSCGSRMFY